MKNSLIYIFGLLNVLRHIWPDKQFLLTKMENLLGPGVTQFGERFIKFSTILNEAYKDEDKYLSKGGRPPFCRLMMFKALLIQSLYNLSDDQLEYQIVDRASFSKKILKTGSRPKRNCILTR